MISTGTCSTIRPTFNNELFVSSLELYQALPCLLEVLGYDALASLNLGQALLELNLLGVFGILVHAPSDFLLKHDRILLHVVDFGLQLLHEKLRIIHLIGNFIQRSKYKQLGERRVVLVDTTEATAIGHVALQEVDEILEDAPAAGRASCAHCRSSSTGGNTRHQVRKYFGKAIIAGVIFGVLLVIIRHVVAPIRAGA